MIVNYQGENFNVGGSKLHILKSTGMTNVKSGTVSEADIKRADEVAQGLFWGGRNPVPITRRRLYFQLDDLRIDCSTEMIPVGVKSQRIECAWEFIVVNECDMFKIID